MDETELAIVRRAYAKQVMAWAGVSNRRVEAAFASVRREDFLGSGPWQVARWPNKTPKDYIPTPDSDPVYLYTNDVFGLIPERRVNNGQPSLHAALIAAADPRDGEHVVHVGAGVGYYTAIMAHLVGETGRVTAIEIDPELARRAEANFQAWPHVKIVHGDGAKTAFTTADVIYINAGVARPSELWLDQLADRGRIVLPLTTDDSFRSMMGEETPSGAVFLINRTGTDFEARMISKVRIIPCDGMRDETSERALAAAFQSGGWDRVTRLYRRDDMPADKCWLRAPGWCLAYE